MEIKQVLTELLKSDRETKGQPVLPAGSRETVLKTLALAIVGKEFLEKYDGTVVELARQSGGIPPSMLAKVLTEEEDDQVLAQGLQVLDDGRLARLAVCLPELAGLA